MTGFMLPRFFNSSTAIARIVIRGCGLPLLKYIWIHMILWACEAQNVAHKESVFVVLTVPAVVITSAGHIMSFASGSIAEVTSGLGIRSAGAH